MNAAPRQDANEPNQYKADERPCPSCRGPISKERIFFRLAFEPTDAELAIATGTVFKTEDYDSDVEMIDDMVDVKGKGKSRAKPAPGRTLRVRKARARVLDSNDDEEEEEEEEDDGSDMSDFIVDDDDEEIDEEERDARKEARRAARSLSKGKARATTRRVVMSDDEDEDIIFGAKPMHRHIPVPKDKVAILPRFLASTKMKSMMESLRAWAESHPDEKVSSSCSLSCGTCADYYCLLDYHCLSVDAVLVSCF